MAEYIEREAVRKILGRYQSAPLVKMKTHFSDGMLTAIGSCIELVDVIPAADVAPVVRCKDCKFQGDEDDCPLLSLSAYTEPDDFCSYGERKDGE